MQMVSTSLIRRGFAGVFFLLILQAAPVIHAASPPAVPALEMKAREAFAAGRFDEALQTFAKLYAETLHPVYLRNIGRCHQKMREPQKAIDAFQDYLAKTKAGKDKISADERTEIEGYIKDMQALRDEQAKAAQTPVTPVTPVEPLNPNPNPNPNPNATPGLTQPTPPPPGLTATPAQPMPVEEQSPVYTKWWFWTIIGVAVVGGAVGIYAATRSDGQTCPSGVICQ